MYRITIGPFSKLKIHKNYSRNKDKRINDGCKKIIKQVKPLPQMFIKKHTQGVNSEIRYGPHVCLTWQCHDCTADIYSRHP